MSVEKGRALGAKDVPTPRYPAEMQKLLANVPDSLKVLPINPALDTETLLINFYDAKTEGVVPAYDKYIKTPVNTVIDVHNHYHEINPKYAKGTEYAMQATPIITEVLRSEIETGDKGPEELDALLSRLKSIEGFRNNPANQPPAHERPRKVTDHLSGVGRHQVTRKKKR
jgi:hypothetical protein